MPPATKPVTLPAIAEPARRSESVSPEEAAAGAAEIGSRARAGRDRHVNVLGHARDLAPRPGAHIRPTVYSPHPRVGPLTLGSIPQDDDGRPHSPRVGRARPPHAQGVRK